MNGPAALAIDLQKRGQIELCASAQESGAEAHRCGIPANTSLIRTIPADPVSALRLD